MKKYLWERTDTAAIMFSAVQTKRMSRVFRVSAVLTQEDVNPVKLKRAVTELLVRFPGFCFRQKHGFFWSYLEHTRIMPEIAEESEIPAVSQPLGTDGGPEFRVLYYKRRISLEGSHALADGTGYFEFLKAIVAHYLTLCGHDASECDNIIHPADKSIPQERENAYARYAGREPLAGIVRKDSYLIRPECQHNSLEYIFGLVKTDELKNLARVHNMTVTEFLIGVMIKAIIMSAGEPINENIGIAVPVNLRNFYPSVTLRNFTCDVPVNFHPHGKTDCDIDEICKAVHGQLKAAATKENMQAFLNSTAGLSRNIGARLAPNFIKRPVLRAAQKNTHRKKMTIMMSNIGNINLPEVMENEIERIDFYGGDPSIYGMAVCCTIAGFKGLINICFSSCNREVRLQREFFRILTQNGVSVHIESTHRNGVNENEMR